MYTGTNNQWNSELQDLLGHFIPSALQYHIEETAP